MAKMNATARRYLERARRLREDGSGDDPLEQAYSLVKSYLDDDSGGRLDRRLKDDLEEVCSLLESWVASDRVTTPANPGPDDATSGEPADTSSMEGRKRGKGKGTLSFLETRTPEQKAADSKQWLENLEKNAKRGR